MNDQLKAAILDGRVILFLGAGASIGSTNSLGENPPLGGQMAERIAQKVGWSYQDEPLSTVYAAARSTIGSELDNLLVANYRNVKPSAAYIAISKYPWARIYTTNIDDALESALNSSSQRVNVKNRNDRVEDKDQLFSRLEYIYLNGSARRLEEGFVFSPEEYGKASATQPRWYEEIASDYLQCTFVFIGSTLAEPVFYHQVERYKERAGISAPLSYVILPHATEIQVAGFDSYGLKYISGTLDNFTEWLDKEFDSPPTSTDIAKNRNPELRALLSKTSLAEQLKYAELLQDVTVVSRDSLVASAPAFTLGTIRPFYKGFKPSWRDLLDSVPAQLERFSEILDSLQDSRSKSLFAIIGAAGSGKSTVLKWLALALSDLGRRVYFIERGAHNLGEVIAALDAANDHSYFLFFDRLDQVKSDLKYALPKARKAIVVGAESQNVWHNRLAGDFGGPNTDIAELREISENDVVLILHKLQQFGSWTRLSQMSLRERKRELFIRSKRQLLIGLMETTTGFGFEEIILRDFQSIGSDEDRLFFLVTCIATMHRADLSESMAARALSHFTFATSPKASSARLQGLVECRRERYVARHPSYARKIVESIADKNLIFSSATALLSSFTVYRHPVVKSLDKNDAQLFKSVINHRFLTDIFRGDQVEILKFYSQFEKFFESDGLFWLQYGLSMRSFGRHAEAYELLQTAYTAYPHDHTTHALAQQKMILASSEDIHPPLARSHLQDAIKLLEKLDDILESDDTYPIVTMAEGHVRAMRKLDGSLSARIKAKEYVTVLEHRLRRGVNPRVQSARDRLFAFAATGNWRDDLVSVR